MTAFVKLTETWHALPDTIADAPAMVSDMCAPQARVLAKLVDEEYCMSKRPLVQHLCAMCGHLLRGAFGHGHNGWREAGKPGKPYQTRGGKVVRWDAMPPLLLLYSKELLAQRLSFIFEMICEGGLVMRSCVSCLPWLQYKKERTRSDPQGRRSIPPMPPQRTAAVVVLFALLAILSTEGFAAREFSFRQTNPNAQQARSPFH